MESFITKNELDLLDYLFGDHIKGDQLYPIGDDDDYVQLGDIFREED